MSDRQRIVILGLTITSSWGNGHATTYRGLMRELARRRHQVAFLERDVPWYAENRDLPAPPYGHTRLYGSVEELEAQHADLIRHADLVIVGSYVPDGIEIGRWVCSTARGVTAFYDIDTPVTLAALAAGTCSYLSAGLIPRYDLYLSFTGGPTLERLERHYGARHARPLYCSFDPAAYYPEDRDASWDLGYMGTYCATRQPALDRLMLSAAREARDRRFVVAGPGYPNETKWPANVERRENVAARDHRAFYNAQRYTLNLTRADMIRAGYSPSVRLFEAAACATPIISDNWPGLSTLFRSGSEILIVESARDTLRCLTEVPEAERVAIGRRARRRVLAEHTAEHRAEQLERYLAEAQEATTIGRRRAVAAPPGHPMQPLTIDS
jgi:spore maturation protein CgeB